MVLQVPLEDSMGKLIVYCRAVPYKKNEISGDCCEMYSFNDGAAQDYITGHPRGNSYNLNSCQSRNAFYSSGPGCSKAD